MYYEKQEKEKQDAYKSMLRIVGELSRLYSTSDSPFLYYRAHENIFARCFGMTNNARSDDSADAYGDGIGVGLKTWVGGNNQKVAEFGKLRPQYEGLQGMDLIRRIAEYRNLRIRTTMRMHGIQQMLYHIVKRIPGAMVIYEAAFDPIDIDAIEIDEKRGTENSVYFSDGRHTYHFSLSKNTLYMEFADMEKLDEFKVEIMDDPFSFLEDAFAGGTFATAEKKEQLCLRLYSTDRNGRKLVHEKSGLNQWNGSRRQYAADGSLKKETRRNPDELYIAYPSADRKRSKGFFPPRDTRFDLRLPDGTVISAKVCQEAHKRMPDSEYEKLSPEKRAEEDRRRGEGKAIMSDPNSALGKWLLRDVLEIPEGKPVTYEMLEEYDVDSVIFTKEGDGKYSIDFAPPGTYEKLAEEEKRD